ncbi:MAG TPA: hypothetical protein VFZ91_04010 [Allosphingosinicella sp.]
MGPDDPGPADRTSKSSLDLYAKNIRIGDLNAERFLSVKRCKRHPGFHLNFLGDIFST